MYIYVAHIIKKNYEKKLYFLLPPSPKKNESYYVGFLWDGGKNILKKIILFTLFVPKKQI